jgi:nitrate/TMAO reductase-like tetraheme cytochrome c subunit
MSDRPLRLALLSPVLVVAAAAAANFWLRAEETNDRAGDKAPAGNASRAEANVLKAPANWPANHPLPQVASNCARCHLTAGRELTLAVRDFAHSVHDLTQMSCNDCHGGNTEDDVKAHEDQFGFIGTKLSAHLARCSECHAEEAEVLASGPHHWDFSQRINTKYPTCIDCHGNHDVGNPPDDFALAEVCSDCHRGFERKFPNIASVVHANDELWQTLVALRDRKLGGTTHRVPEQFEPDVAQIRHETMRLMHHSQEPTAEAAQALAGKLLDLRTRLQNWLKNAN